MSRKPSSVLPSFAAARSRSAAFAPAVSVDRTLPAFPTQRAARVPLAPGRLWDPTLLDRLQAPLTRHRD